MRVFPAYAGVFLLLVITSHHSLSLPRIRGGVSCECRGEEDPIWWWEEADHFEDGALILRLRMSELPKEEQK